MITSIEKFKKKKEEEQYDKEMKDSSFAVNKFYEVIDDSRYLPRELAIKLIQQVMVDHLINLQEIELKI